MSASLSRHSTRAASSTQGSGIVLPIVMASTLAVAASYSARKLRRRRETEGGKPENPDDEIDSTSGSEEIKASSVDEDESVGPPLSKTPQKSPTTVVSTNDQMLIDNAFCEEPKPQESPSSVTAIDKQTPIEGSIRGESKPQESPSPMDAVDEEVPIDNSICAEPKPQESPSPVVAVDHQMPIDEAICVEPKPEEKASSAVIVDDQMSIDEVDGGELKRHESPPSVVVMDDQKPMEKIYFEECKLEKSPHQSATALDKQMINDKASYGNSTGTSRLELHKLTQFNETHFAKDSVTSDISVSSRQSVDMKRTVAVYIKPNKDAKASMAGVWT